jgi:hypothetical protein
MANRLERRKRYESKDVFRMFRIRELGYVELARKQ